QDFETAEGIFSGAGTGRVSPVFLTRFRDSEWELFKELGIPLQEILHGEQEYEFSRPLSMGDALEYETEFTQCLEKVRKDTFMRFLTFETRFRSGEDRVALSRTLVIQRGKVK